MASGGFRIKVKGADDVVISFASLRKHVRSTVAEGLYEGADKAVVAAKGYASARLRRRSGDLVGGIAKKRAGNKVYIRATAKHRGYAYPGKFEYSKDKSRQFLKPGAEAGQDALAEGVGNALDSAHKRAGF